MGFIELTVGPARVVFTDRHGGVSEAPFDSANLSLSVGDDPGRVRENRRRVGAALGGAMLDHERWSRVRQVHGRAVVTAGAAGRKSPAADAVVTTAVGVPLVVLMADCAPVALVGANVVAAVHAGWRGLLAGIVERAVAALRDVDPAPPRAVIGPCISPAHYAFGAHDLAVVADRLGPVVRARTDEGDPALDLRAGVRAALAGAGVTDVTDVDVCTSDSLDYFSHRRDGPTGRQALLVTRDA